MAWPAGGGSNPFRFLRILGNAVDQHFSRSTDVKVQIATANDLKIKSVGERLSETYCIMKQYLIDELRPEDHQKVKQYLDETYGPVEMGSIYWVPLAADVLTDIQQQHTDCQPFNAAIDLQEDRLVLELLVRTKKKIRCACIGYAEERQRNWLIDQVDAIFKRLGVIT